jgi:hypothetical protein
MARIILPVKNPEGEKGKVGSPLGIRGRGNGKKFPLTFYL